MKFQEGDKIVTCGRATGFHSNGDFFAPKVYEARIRKKDKVLVWKLSFIVEKFRVAVPGFYPNQAVMRLSRAYARDNDLPFAKDIKDNMDVTVAKPRKRATTKKRKDPATGIVVEEPIVVGRFRKIDDDSII